MSEDRVTHKRQRMPGEPRSVTQLYNLLLSNGGIQMPMPRRARQGSENQPTTALRHVARIHKSVRFLKKRSWHLQNSSILPLSVSPPHSL